MTDPKTSKAEQTNESPNVIDDNDLDAVQGGFFGQAVGAAIDAVITGVQGSGDAHAAAAGARGDKKTEEAISTATDAVTSHLSIQSASIKRTY